MASRDRKEKPKFTREIATPDYNGKHLVEFLISKGIEAGIKHDDDHNGTQTVWYEFNQYSRCYVEAWMAGYLAGWA